jgi:Protein of unknown function (DUF1203)
MSDIVAVTVGDVALSAKRTAPRIVAIETRLAEAARAGKDAQYGFPAYTAPAGAGLPCRHCLQWIEEGEDATLFTLDPFAGVEKLPLPGPVYVHARACERYAEDWALPMDLLKSPRTLNAYAAGRKLVAQEYVEAATAKEGIERLLEREEVDYIHVRSTTAGCFTFRIEKG